ncbi:MAG: 4-hydroxyphenylacetate 3-hydroxylase family protein, partial [Candidatus Binataceae bacterium]
MGVRTGKQYIEGLRDGRRIFVNGEKVRDVAEYPPFKGVIGEIAALYDRHHDPALASQLTYESPTTGEPVSSSFLLARNRDEMMKRVRGERMRAEFVGGMMGRQPDFMNALVTDMAAARAHFGRNEPAYGKNVWNYYELCREKDLCLTHALVDPQIDRSKGVTAQEALHIAAENDRGLVVSGARMLATLAAVSDEIVIAPFANRARGEEDFAIVFALPAAAPGLTFICRQTYDRGDSKFDRPLTGRYDEGDALAIFDNVLVPWERIFAARDLDIYNHIRPVLPGYLWLQATIRSAAKLRFMAGLATLVAEAVGRTALPRYQELIGGVVGDVELADGLVRGAADQLLENVTALASAPGEAGGAGQRIGGSHGTLNKGLVGVSAVRLFFPEAHERAVQAIRLIGSSGLVMTPGERDFDNAEISEILARHFKGRDKTARERVKIMKMAWDSISGDFGGRQMLYEWFFAGDPFNNRILYYNSPLNHRCTELARGLLGSD